MPVVVSEELSILRIAGVVMDLERIEVIRNVRDRYGWSEGVFGIQLDVLGDSRIRGKVSGKAWAHGRYILDVILIDVDGLIGKAASQLDLRVDLDLPWERHTAPCQESVRNISCSIGIQIGADERRGKIAQVGIRFIDRALGQAPDVGGIKLVVALKRNLCRQFKLTVPGTSVPCKHICVLSLDDLRRDRDQSTSMVLKVLGAHRQTFAKLMLNLKIPGDGIRGKVANVMVLVDKRNSRCCRFRCQVQISLWAP